LGFLLVAQKNGLFEQMFQPAEASEHLRQRRCALRAMSTAPRRFDLADVDLFQHLAGDVQSSQACGSKREINDLLLASGVRRDTRLRNLRSHGPFKI
jgi:hypothetical protein